MLESPELLAPAERAELTVWADAQQSQGQPGGLVLALWLAHGLAFAQAGLDDLRAWCESRLRP